MKGEAEMTGPELVRVVGTRIALGVGLGFLLADRFTEQERRAIGWTLLLGGACMGATMAYELFGQPQAFNLAFGRARDQRREPQPQERQERWATAARG
jgi:hypothetical protein